MPAKRRGSVPEYDFGDVLAIPVEQRIAMSEGHRLKPDEPSPGLLFDWCVKGRLIRRLDERLKLPSFIGPGGRRYTTEAAWRWWVAALNECDGR